MELPRASHNNDEDEARYKSGEYFYKTLLLILKTLHHLNQGPHHMIWATSRLFSPVKKRKLFKWAKWQQPIWFDIKTQCFVFVVLRVIDLDMKHVSVQQGHASKVSFVLNELNLLALIRDIFTMAWSNLGNYCSWFETSWFDSFCLAAFDENEFLSLKEIVWVFEVTLCQKIIDS